MPSPQQPARPNLQPQPSRQPSGARTDPTLYQWDRLTPEQQQAVLETLGVRATRGSASRRLVMLPLLVVLVLLAVVVLVIAAYLIVHAR
jgi:hypothetical protein